MKRIVYAFFALIFLIFSVIIPDFCFISQNNAPTFRQSDENGPHMHIIYIV